VHHDQLRFSCGGDAVFRRGCGDRGVVNGHKAQRGQAGEIALALHLAVGLVDVRSALAGTIEVLERNVSAANPPRQLEEHTPLSRWKTMSSTKVLKATGRRVHW
jgi:hypothetical protein